MISLWWIHWRINHRIQALILVVLQKDMKRPLIGIFIDLEVLFLAIICLFYDFAKMYPIPSAVLFFCWLVCCKLDRLW